ncbi:hypothetical protein [Desulfosporosinus sp.]|uniref:hypothetical protein n=1 Tax=Desulfosporosinus sp. TaxID=157907 RepID=UPI0025BEE664|nr:hypothetical protein [Desulfosporosinus sp.]MBC2721728.1 hypothetical protein [Desulfosporosinus sp.]MBC2726338.1 hypothetical protein [Desulfosporosinus sp.]
MPLLNRPDCVPFLPATPFSFSILVTSPIRRNLLFCPVSSIVFPLAKTRIQFASMIVAGLDVLMAFLFKRSLAHPPNPANPAPEQYPVTLTMPQLTQLIQATLNGDVPLPSPVSPVPGQGFGPVGADQPLFPDNLSVSLILSAPFAPFDGSPDTSFNVPLFEIPGAPGNLIIAACILIAQFYIERAGVGTPNGNNSSKGQSTVNNGKGGISNVNVVYAG